MARVTLERKHSEICQKTGKMLFPLIEINKIHPEKDF